MKGRAAAPAALAALCALTFGGFALRPATTEAAVHFKNCGTYKSLRVQLYVRGVSCPTARRIVSAWLHGPSHDAGIYRVRGYPSWKCSSGTRSGSCALHGHFGANVPEIEFSYLATPLPPKASCNRVVEYRPDLFSDITEYVGMSCAEARNIVLTHNRSGDGTFPGFECRADPSVQVAGGGAECVSGSRRVKWTNE
jgi:hypothetical protein